MTILVRGSSFRCVALPASAPCPPWCTGTDCRSTDPTVTRYHIAREASVPLGAPDVTACVVACRDDEPDAPAGEAYVYLSGDGPVRQGHDWAESLTPAAAVQLGRALIAAALVAAGMATAAGEGRS